MSDASDGARDRVLSNISPCSSSQLCCLTRIFSFFVAFFAIFGESAVVRAATLDVSRSMGDKSKTSDDRELLEDPCSLFALGFDKVLFDFVLARLGVDVREIVVGDGEDERDGAADDADDDELCDPDIELELSSGGDLLIESAP